MTTARIPSALSWFLNAASGPTAPGLANPDIMQDGYVAVLERYYAGLIALWPHVTGADLAGHYQTAPVVGVGATASMRPLWDASPEVLSAGMVDGCRWLAERCKSFVAYHAPPPMRPRLTAAQLDGYARKMESLGVTGEVLDSAAACATKDGTGLVNAFRYAELRRLSIPVGIEDIEWVRPALFRWHEGNYSIYQMHTGGSGPLDGFEMRWTGAGWWGPGCHGVCSGYTVQLGGNVPAARRVEIALALLADPRVSVTVEPFGVGEADIRAMVDAASRHPVQA